MAWKSTLVGGGRVAAANSPPIWLTVTFMLLALAHLVALHVWLVLHPGVLTGHRLLGGPDLLVAVHLFTLGFGSLLITAALHQLLPAVLDAPLRSLRLGAAALLGLLMGSELLIYGFTAVRPVYLRLAGVILAVAVGTVVLHLGVSLRKARQFSATGWFLAAALGHLALVATLGVVLALAMATGTLGLGTGRLVLAHLVLGLGGWLGLAVVGASYRLVTMFTGSGITGSMIARPVLLTMVTAIPALALTLILGAPGWLSAALAVPVAAALGAYGADLWRMSRQSHRPNEASGRFARVGIVFLWAGLAAGLGALVAAGLLGTGQLALAGTGPVPVVRLTLAAVYLLMVGWIGTLALGQLHMIIPFLVWLQLYKPLAGKMKVPMLADLQKGSRMGVVLWLVAGGVAVTVAGVLLELGALGIAGSALAGVGTLWTLADQTRIVYQGLVARRTGKNPVGSTRRYDPRT
jgi:hypothetical protein